VGLYAGTDDDTPLDDGNKAVAVRARIAMLLTGANGGARRAALDAVRAGFCDVVPELRLHLQLFSGHELQNFMCGVARLEPQMLLSSLTFADGVSEVTRAALRRFISECGEARLASFLFFVTSLITLPPSGLRQNITVEHDPDAGNLPKAHTCFYTLDLPNYDSFETLRDKVAFTIENTKGFELQ